MKIGLVSLLLVIFATQMCLQEALVAAEQDRWPNRGPYRSMAFYGPKTKVPVQVIYSLQRRWHTDPSTWMVVVVQVVTGQSTGNPIISVLDPSGHEMYFLPGKDYWADLKSPRNLPYVNQALGNYLEPRDLRNNESVSRYLFEVSLFYKPLCAVADQDFKEVFLGKEHLDAWMHGLDRNPESLLSLCRDPIVKQSGGHATIQGIVLVGDGSVEQWTLTMKFASTVRIANIKIERIRPKGTFSYAANQ